MSGHILAIDQGTTNTKALLLDARGAIVARASRAMVVSHPKEGWAEQSAEAIWQSVAECLSDCIAAVPGAEIAAFAISNQRESVVLWERETGRPVGPCVTWQCMRSAERLDRLRSAETEALVAVLSGLALNPMFPAAKIGWLLDATPGARARAERGELAVGTIDSWLLWNFTAGAVHACDAGNASRTQLFDIHALRWSDPLAALFEIPVAILPDVKASDSRFGVSAAPDLPSGIPIHAMMGDSHAALYGHGVRGPGIVKATYGTGSSLMTLTEQPVLSKNGLSTTIAWMAGGRVHHALEGNITVSGQAAAFVARLLGLADADALTDLARTVPTSGGVVVLPALAGLGAPYWQAHARGAISGLSLGSTPAHVARATLEAITLQVRDVFDAMQIDLGIALSALSADGGAARSDLLMQLQADLLDRPVLRGAAVELSAIGAAMMAGVAVGLYAATEDEGAAEEAVLRFTPAMEPARRDAILSGWSKAVATAIGG
ncbi:FGGY family carbohydrate kinase [Kaistia dalseonensis]|uniref:ATP:glycerol 3-phosphotransferase n=1 Tax=Kaistia dalseonensis TaxID=410840 RepID=A0ABU0HDQ2_9HYPH|nr:FGGY family carbohydrate kinase [Kaistia dalseonensis]MCX5497807.1 FGGY family carbohydrate kinase [Kaistia dalseonensis]MDQ0440451.1 glycerol kinase [Kaistia dalseonensis]